MSSKVKGWFDVGDERRLLWRMFFIALAVRLLYMTLAHTYRLRAIDDHFDFGWEMGRIARALATGYGFADPFNGHSGPSAWTPPLYPLILAAAFKLFGVYTRGAAWAILAVNCVLSAATAPAVYELAWRTFGREGKGRSIALWSGWLWVLYPAAMQYAVKWVWDMSLTACLFAWVLVLALRLRQASTGVLWVAFGVLWGLIALSNSSLLIFLPACGLWILWGGLTAKTLRQAVLGAACCVAVVTPWVVRNAMVFHKFIPLRSNFGAELYESVQVRNNGFPWGTTVSLAVTSPDYRRYQRLGEVAYAQQQGAAAMQVIRAHRGYFWGNVLKRVDFFWVSVPHPLNDESLQSLLVEAVREMNYAFLSLGALLGLGLALRQGVPGAWLYFWAFALIPLLYYFVTVQARFRHPLEPVITILIVYLFQSATFQPDKPRSVRG